MAVPAVGLLPIIYHTSISLSNISIIYHTSISLSNIPIIYHTWISLSNIPIIYNTSISLSNIPKNVRYMHGSRHCEAKPPHLIGKVGRKDKTMTKRRNDEMTKRRKDEMTKWRRPKLWYVAGLSMYSAAGWLYLVPTKSTPSRGILGQYLTRAKYYGRGSKPR